MTVYLIVSTLLSFAVSALLGKIFIPVLMSKKLGQPIREIGPRWHKSKEGTPTMGGLFFIASTAFALCVSFFFCDANTLIKLWITFAMALLFGLIGVIDDGKKLFEHKNDGLKPYQKILLQLVVSGAYLFVMTKLGYITTNVHIPFFSVNVEFGFFFYILAILFIIGTVNAVNFTDGVDGLASSVTGVVCMFFAVSGITSGDNATAVLSCAVFGGLAGFLVFNAHPARVFMGDTGSMFLGGIVIGLAFLINSPLIIVVCGIIYYIEALSVILQVAYFKISHGKRIFKMTPIHHHFEMCGFGENKIVFLFSAVTVVFSIIAFFLG